MPPVYFKLMYIIQRVRLRYLRRSAAAARTLELNCPVAADAVDMARAQCSASLASALGRGANNTGGRRSGPRSATAACNSADLCIKCQSSLLSPFTTPPDTEWTRLYTDALPSGSIDMSMQLSAIPAAKMLAVTEALAAAAAGERGWAGRYSLQMQPEYVRGASWQLVPEGARGPQH
ncbi:MAG: hypothetical protein FRX49_03707 [Trebouxia sp. A1-2]|nr:MAG: hypothetical protein FRX49_03707 [Trebouxia sp. A1-2]